MLCFTELTVAFRVGRLRSRMIGNVGDRLWADYGKQKTAACSMLA